jgi:hypothetical protein
MLGLLLCFSFLWLGLAAISGNAYIPSGWVQANTPSEKSRASEERKKIAAGEHEVYEEANEGLVGPFGEEVQNFHESWTLWQNAKRGYEVEGERRFETPKKEPQKHAFRVELSLFGANIRSALWIDPGNAGLWVSTLVSQKKRASVRQYMNE